MKAILALADGTIFEGEHFGATGETSGEVVFNTSMTGYQEILTDPSYKGQIVTMTLPVDWKLPAATILMSNQFDRKPKGLLCANIARTRAIGVLSPISVATSKKMGLSVSTVSTPAH